MKKFLLALILAFISIGVMSQENYKLGDFNASQVKAKSLKLDNDWKVVKNSNGTLSLYYKNATTAAFTVSTTNSYPVTTGKIIMDTASFTTTATKKSIYIAGVSNNDVFVVSAKMGAPATRIGTGEQLGWYARTDSLVVTRTTGTTSGLSFSYIRFK